MIMAVFKYLILLHTPTPPPFEPPALLTHLKLSLLRHSRLAACRRSLCQDECFSLHPLLKLQMPQQDTDSCSCVSRESTIVALLFQVAGFLLLLFLRHSLFFTSSLNILVIHIIYAFIMLMTTVLCELELNIEC